jgi:hypothetical protein
MTNDHARIDDLAFFEALAAEMNAHPETYTILGEIDLDVVLVMQRDPEPFRVRLGFSGITCDTVATAAAGEESQAHCAIVAPLAVWEAMFADIRANGRATGRQTLNALTMWGEEMWIEGTDPMGTDRVSRFNQTLQQFLDGAAHLGAAAPA